MSKSELKRLEIQRGGDMNSYALKEKDKQIAELERKLAEQKEESAITLWVSLMDWCKANRSNPADHNDLFKIVDKLRCGAPDFTSMPVIKEDDSGAVVRCTEFSKVERKCQNQN